MHRPHRGPVRLRSAKGRRASSTRWLRRQLKDPYVHGAQEAGYRSRAAYKLLEIDRKFGLLRRGRRVLDLGAAPGGWVQVAVEKGCRVVGLDLVPIAPIEGAVLLEGDVFDPAAVEQARQALGGPADVVLSDLAAAATGQRSLDRLRAEALAEAVLDLLPDVLRPGGALVLKLLHGVESTIAPLARPRFATIKLVRPDATRRESSEIYLVGLDHRPARSDAD